MKQLFALAFFALVTGCQINVMQPATDPTSVVPDANARIARKLLVGGLDSKTVYGQERYEYDTKGQLTKISRLNRTAAGQFEMYGYDVYAYSDGQLREMTSYSVQQGRAYATVIRRYEYPSTQSIVEQTYAVNTQSGTPLLTARTETTMAQGLKMRVVSYYVLNQTMTKSHEIAYRYEAGRLVAEENLNSNGSLRTAFRYAYKGRTAKVEEFMSGRTESISEQALQYDMKGRLIRSEVTKMNPLYCVAFVQGSATVYEYAE